MAINKVPNPQYKEGERLVTSQKTNVAKAAAQHAARQSILFKLCKEKEKAEIALNNITDKVDDAFSECNDAESLLSETRETLTDAIALLKETPRYIQGDN